MSLSVDLKVYKFGSRSSRGYDEARSRGGRGNAYVHWGGEEEGGEEPLEEILSCRLATSESLCIAHCTTRSCLATPPSCLIVPPPPPPPPRTVLPPVSSSLPARRLSDTQSQSPLRSQFITITVFGLSKTHLSRGSGRRRGGGGGGANGGGGGDGVPSLPGQHQRRLRQHKPSESMSHVF